MYTLIIIIFNLIISILIIFNLIIFYYFYIGNIVYIKYNNSIESEKLKFKKEKLETPIYDEYNELIESYEKREYCNMIMELFDYIHSYGKVILLSTFTEKIYMSFIPWLVIFIISYPVSLKLAYRYYKYGCIRNHINKKPTHNCSSTIDQEFL